MTMEFQQSYSRVTDKCEGGEHWWRPVVGEAVPLEKLVGWRCYCGEKAIVVCECGCSNKHIKVV